MVEAVEQFVNFYIKDNGDTIDLIDTCIDFTQLNTTELGIFNTGFIRHFFNR